MRRNLPLRRWARDLAVPLLVPSMTGRFWLAVSWLRERVVEGVNDFATMLVVLVLTILLTVLIAGPFVRLGWFG